MGYCSSPGYKEKNRAPLQRVPLRVGSRLGVWDLLFRILWMLK